MTIRDYLSQRPLGELRDPESESGVCDALP